LSPSSLQGNHGPHGGHGSHGSHGGHGQHGAHGTPGTRRTGSTGEGWSLLRASLVERLAGAAALLAGLWGLVAWAMQP
jgi:hypothetical protein